MKDISIEQGEYFGFAVELKDNVSGPVKNILNSLGLLRKNLKQLPKHKKGPDTISSSFKNLGRHIKRATDNLSFMQRVFVGLSIRFATLGLTRNLKRLGRGFVDVVMQGAEFEKTIKFAGAIAGIVTREGLEPLRREAKRLGATTSYTAKQAADGLVILAQAGLSVKQATDALAPSLYLAGASGLNLARASQFIVDQLGIFNLSSERAAEVADIITAGFTSAQTTAGELQLALRQTSPIAAAAGRSLGEVVEALGIFAKGGFRGGQAGTALRNVLASIQVPSANLRRSLEYLGLTIEDLNPKYHTLRDIFRKLRPLMERQDLLWKLFGKRTASAVVALLKKGDIAFARMNLQMQQANTTLDVYMSQINSVAGAMKIAQSAVAAFKLELFDIIKWQVKEDIRKFYGFFQRLGAIAKRIGPVIQEIYKIGRDVLNIFLRRVSGFFRVLQDNFYLLSDVRKKTDKEIRDIVAPLVIYFTVLRLQIKEFTEAFIDGFSIAWGYARKIASIVSDILGPVISAFMSFIGWTDKGETKIARIARAIGTLVGVFTALIALKAVLIIPKFVFHSFMTFGLVSYQAISKTVGALRYMYALIAGAYSVGIVKGLGAIGLLFKKIGVALLGFMKAFSWFSLFLGALALFGVAAKHVFSVVGDNALTFRQKVEKVIKGMTTTIVGLFGSIAGLSKEQVKRAAESVTFYLGRVYDQIKLFFTDMGFVVLDVILSTAERIKYQFSIISTMFSSLWKRFVVVWKNFSFSTAIFGSDKERKQQLAKIMAAFAKIKKEQEKVAKAGADALEQKRKKRWEWMGGPYSSWRSKELEEYKKRGTRHDTFGERSRFYQQFLKARETNPSLKWKSDETTDVISTPSPALAPKDPTMSFLNPGASLFAGAQLPEVIPLTSHETRVKEAPTSNNYNFGEKSIVIYNQTGNTEELVRRLLPELRRATLEEARRGVR